MTEHTTADDRIRLPDVLRKLPELGRRAPKIVQGYYYYALLGPESRKTLASVLEDNARSHPNQPAILYGDRTLTYAALDAWANRFAHYYRARGIGRGDVIAIDMENRPELFAAIMGAHKLGAACAMINTAQKGAVLAHSLTLTHPKLLVIGAEQVPLFETVREEMQASGHTRIIWIQDPDQPGDCPEGYEDGLTQLNRYPDTKPRLADPPRAGDVAFYLFTSGTTGLPKAAPSSHQKWFKAYGGFGFMSLAMTPDDVMYVTLPFYHGTALLVCWGATLAGASTLAVRRKFSASAFWDDVRRYHATCFGYVGELCRYLLNQPPSPNDRNHSLRKMIGNGLRPSIWREFKERFGIEQVAELYGSSEGNIGFSNFLNLDNTVGFSTAPFALVKYHEGTREPVRDEKGRLIRVRKGEPGLLIGKITRRWRFEGYTQKEATEKVILRDCFRKGDAWFNTGDVLREIGFRHLQFVDRMGDTYRWKGENVSTTEVENIFDGFPGIEEAIVYGVEIPGTNGKAGMATLVPADRSCPLDMDALARHLFDNLPPYAVPVFLRITDAIEKTGTFKYRKVDIQKLGYSLERPGDEVWVMLPGDKVWTRMTPEIEAAINAGQHRF
ncbi:long-chain-acyl-CoA synthetase [Hahella sp. SMD15-11]|uniref:Long-chain-acyl-CoA synthetase n=1 Tax=Thermohahella caldifontis TaxID=3142973 RepID=A0AB39UZS9_9GAMM